MKYSRDTNNLQKIEHIRLALKSENKERLAKLIGCTPGALRKIQYGEIHDPATTITDGICDELQLDRYTGLPLAQSARDRAGLDANALDTLREQVATYERSPRALARELRLVDAKPLERFASDPGFDPPVSLVDRLARHFSIPLASHTWTDDLTGTLFRVTTYGPTSPPLLESAIARLARAADAVLSAVPADDTPLRAPLAGACAILRELSARSSKA